MNSRRKYRKQKGLHQPSIQRQQSADEIAEVFSVNLETVHGWARDGCPNDKPGKAYRFNDGEVREWLQKNNRQTKPGRPRKTDKPATEEDKDYWLARKYRIQALAAEGEYVSLAELASEVSQVLTTLRNSMQGLPAKLAVALEGRNAAERQAYTESEIERTLNEVERRLRELGERGETAQATAA